MLTDPSAPKSFEIPALLTAAEMFLMTLCRLTSRLTSSAPSARLISVLRQWRVRVTARVLEELEAIAEDTKTLRILQ